MPSEKPFQKGYGPWALVAGASEGIGLAFAEQLAAKGLNLIMLSRSIEKLEAARQRVQAGHDVDVRLLSADLSAPDCMAAIGAQTSGLEIGLLVYNAGAVHGAGLFHDEPVDKALALVNLNCRSPVLLTHHFGAHMRKRRRGGIILLSSLAALGGGSYIATYAASKAFDIILAQSLWHELAPSNVDVLCLVAGATRTPAMAESGLAFDGDEASGFSVMESDHVASEGLAHLRDGPVWIAGEANRGAAAMMQTMPRKSLVELMSQATANMYGKSHISVNSAQDSSGRVT